MKINKYWKLVLIHLLLMLLGGGFYSLLHKAEAINPIVMAFEDYSMTDFYFSQIRTREKELDTIHPDIYIIDIGYLNKVNTRKNISNLLQLMDEKIYPKAVGIDITFKGETNNKVDSALVYWINKTNPVLATDIKPIDKKINGKYPMYFSGTDISQAMQIQNKIEGFTNLSVEKNTPATERYFVPLADIDAGSKEHFTVQLLHQIDQSNYIQFKNEFKDLERAQIINYRGNYFESNHVVPIDDVESRIDELKGKIILVGQCEYASNKSYKVVPINNEDAHFTPRNKNYIGKSYPDMNGVEIHAHIIANMITKRDNGKLDIIWSNKWVNNIIVIILSLLVYFGQLYWDYKSKLTYKVAKHILQLVLVLLCLFLSIWLLERDVYFDPTTLAFVSFFTPEIMEIFEGIVHKTAQLLAKYNIIKVTDEKV